jgi:hypothetical protein
MEAVAVILRDVSSLVKGSNALRLPDLFGNHTDRSLIISSVIHAVVRILAIFGLLLCCSVDALPTTVVAIRTPTDVFIAADSLAAFLSAAPQSVCKIYQIGSDFLAVAGIDHDPITQFNVSIAVAKAISGKQGFNNKFAAARKSIIPALRAEMLNLRSTRLNEFEFAKNQGVSMILAGVEGQVPFAIGQSFKISLGPNGDIGITQSKIQRCPGIECPNGNLLIKMGQMDAIDRYLATLKTKEQGDAESFARKLVQLEIDDPEEKKLVGAPIDVLRISTKGPDWRTQKAGCPIVVNVPAPHAANVPIMPKN